MTASARLLIFSVAIILKFAASSKVERNICPNRNVSKYEEAKTNSCLTLDQCGRTHCMESNMTVSMGAGQHELQATLNLSNISSLVLTGVSTNTTTITCSNSTAIVFNSCSNIRLQNLTIEGCGVESKTAAVFFQDGDTVTLEDVTISDSICAAIVAYNVKGTMSLLHSFIRDIKPTCTPNICAGNTISYINANNSSYHFIANNTHFSNSKYYSHNGSAGLSLNVSNCYAKITITNSKFFCNYHNSSPGGNLRILLQNITKLQRTIHLENVNISLGKAFKGGGLAIDIHTPLQNSSQDCITIAVFKKVLFSNNEAEFLGAGLYIKLAESKHARTCQYIRFINCSFIGNSLSNSKSGGIAFHSNSYIVQGFVKQVVPQYKTELRNCIFHDNSDCSNESSVIVINAHRHFRISSVTVTNNYCNAITAIHSNIVLSGSTWLSNNVGSSGGGLLLCENAILYFTPNTYVEIANNSVQHAGGGICVEPQCLEARPRCFYQLYMEPSQGPMSTLNITVNVRNNFANFAGDNIFGGDVDYCYMLDSSKSKLEKIKHDNYSVEVFTTLFQYGEGASSVTSPPRKAQLCNSTSNLGPFFLGQSFDIFAILLGQLNGQVPGVIEVESMRKSFKLNGSLILTKNDTCDKTPFFIKSDSAVNTTEYVNLKLTVRQSGDKSGYEKLGINDTCMVQVAILPCPAGTTFNTTKGCKSNIGHIDIDLQGKNPQFYLYDKPVWIQLNYNNSIDTKYPATIHYKKFCPLDYCLPQWSLSLAQNHNNPYPICNNYRSKIFCGACAEKYSAILGSSSCKKCRNNFLLLLPLALAGIALVVFITVLNLTISKGTLSGLIFYAHIIESNSQSLIPEQKNTYQTFLRVFIGWLNLDLAIPVCFYDGMDAYVKAWLEFAFPIYISIISLLIILLSEKYAWMARLASKNSTKVLATLVLLSYTRYLRAIIFNFSFIKYRIINGTKDHSQALWLIDPNIIYWEPRHAVLFTFSLLLILVCLPFAFILLFIKPLQHFSHSKLFRWIFKLKPFLDAFTGPYTDNGRFWPGMLLVARIVISLTAGMDILNDSTIRLGMTILVIIFLLITAALVRPGLYINGKLDYLEYFFLLNLCGLCLAQGYHYHQDSTSSTFYDKAFKILVSLSLTAFAGIILYHIWLRLRRFRISLKIVNWILQKYGILRKLLRKGDSYQTLHNYPPHVEFIHHREPLIAEHEE